MKQIPTFALLGILAAACGNNSLVVERPTSSAVNQEVTVMWTDDVRRTARTGDWILTRSYSLTGDVIVASTSGESVSHASIYDARSGTIIEAVRPEVQEVPLERLLHRNRLAIVIRPTGLTEEQRIAAVERARSKVGTTFDLGGLVGLDDPAEFYCSELVFWASGIDDPDRPRVIAPADLPRYGEVVYYSGKRDKPEIQAAARARKQLLANR